MPAYPNKTTAGNTIFVNPNIGPSGNSPLGGGQRFPDKYYTWFKRGNATEDYLNRGIVLAAGQVLKRGTWLQSSPNGEMVAHGAFTQNSTVLLSGSMSSGDTLKVGSITYTAATTLTPLQVANAFAALSIDNADGYPSFDATAQATSNPALSATLGSFSAWVPGWNFTVDQNTVVEYNASTVADVSGGVAGSVVAIGLIAESQGFVSPAGAFTNAAYTAASTSTLTVSTFYSSIPGTVTVQLAGSLTSTTVVIGGITFTFNTNAATGAEVAAAIGLIPSGAVSTASTLTDGLVTVTATTGVVTRNAGSVVIGTLTGTNAGWNFYHAQNSYELTANATPGNSTNGILATSGTATGLTVMVGQSNTTQGIAGLLLFDTDATAGPTPSRMFTTGDFWAEGIQWENHPLPSTVSVPTPGGAGYTGQTNGYDYVVNASGAAVTCTPYWTGVRTLMDAQKFIENTVGSAFFTLGSWQENAGEIEP